MREVRRYTYIIAILLFCFMYKICDFFYYNEQVKNVQLWWGLKSQLYALIIALTFYASSIKKKGFIKFILNIGIGFAVSNLIDKAFFSVLEFNENDIIMIILTVCFSVLNYLKDRRNWQK